MSSIAIQHGRVDAAGALVVADPEFARLNAGAGGAIGAPIAISQVAAIVRLARKLRIVVSRAAFAADDGDRVDMWVRAAPDGDGVAIVVSGWNRRARSLPAPAAPRTDHAEVDWTWETDAALRVTALSPTVGGLLGIDGRAQVGEPLTQLFSFIEDASGALPVLEALAGQRRFDGQLATLRGVPAARYRLRAVPLVDGVGRFGGFRGGAVRLPDVSAGDRPDDGAFAARLDGALRAPLARIISNADDLQARTEGPLRSEYADYATDIAAAGRHLLSLVDDLVDLQAIERPGFRPDPDALDLADLARRASGLLGVRAAAKQVRIERPAEDDALAAVGEFRRALQILVNLIGNAVRYSPSGGTVTVSVERLGDLAAIVVADEGKGVAPEDQARIFGKFERVDPSEPGGTGLGLYIARRLARAMDGDLTVESAPAQGARFTLTLPAA